VSIRQINNSSSSKERRCTCKARTGLHRIFIWTQKIAEPVCPNLKFFLFKRIITDSEEEEATKVSANLMEKRHFVCPIVVTYGFGSKYASVMTASCRSSKAVKLSKRL